jgi:O-antigen ligase
MRRHLRSAIVPLYLLLCLILGGSVQGIWTNALLQLLAVVIIGWSLLAKRPHSLTGAAKGLIVLVGLTLLLIFIQLIPLPPSIWSALPGRGFVADGFSLLGQAPPWLPISLTPYETAATALTLLPPLAVLSAMLLADAYRPSSLVVAILIGALAGVLVGALQVGSADPVNSPWYFYEITSYGTATGFFANSNHMAALLVICVPFLLALVEDIRDRSENPKSRSAALLLAFAGLSVLLVGIVLNGSIAILLLGPPVFAISASMLLARQMKMRGPLAILALVGAASMLVVYLTPLHDQLAGENATSVSERQAMWSNTVPAILEFLPLGSGVSSFPVLYPRFENPLEVTRTFTNHAHNDYLEIALETGLPGILLLIGFLIWWGMSTRSIWRTQRTDRYAQAATIASAALLLHSLVDYPLRTAALSAIFAACLAFMAQPRSRNGESEAELWPTRHLTV